MLDSLESSFAGCDDGAQDDAKLVEAPADMARLLLAASPRRAASFALAAHERACWMPDDDRAEFWLEVMALLTNPRARTIPSDRLPCSVQS